MGKWLLAGVMVVVGAGLGFGEELNPGRGKMLEGEAVAKALEGFEFDSQEVRGVMLRVEKSLAGQEKKLIKTLDAFLKEEDAFTVGRQKYAERRDEIVAEINRLTGFTPDEKRLQEQRDAFNFYLSFGQVKEPGKELTFYLINMDALKAYLKEGHEVPGCAYDKETDKALCRFQLGTRHSKGGDPEKQAVIIPLGKKMTAAGFEMYLKAYSRLRDEGGLGAACHEICEMGLLWPLKPADPYCRWFSDGFAHALAIELVKRHEGPGAAGKFEKLIRYGGGQATEKELNLRYWPSGGYGIETDLPGERDLSYSRYAAAMKEAKRITDRHGVEVVRKIMAKATAEAPIHSDRLIEIIREVTGEDMNQRLARYQTFKTPMEGVQKYESRPARNGEEEKRNLIRMHELLLDSPRAFAQVSTRLSKQGLAKQADETFRKRCQQTFAFKDPLFNTWMREFFSYAVNEKRPEIAFDLAGKVLEMDPEYAFALMVRARQLLQEGKLDEAQTLAQRLLKWANTDKQYEAISKEEQSVFDEIAKARLKANEPK